MRMEEIFSYRSAATNETIHLAIAFDENYLYPFYALVCSILSNNYPPDVQFHVVAAGVSEQEKKRIESYISALGSAIRFYTIDEDLVSRFTLINQWSSAVYYRIFFPKIICPRIGRILYLDTDTLVINNLWELYGHDMDGYPLGAVYDNYVKTQPLLGIEIEGEYFNSGVLLIDVHLWNEQRISESAIKFLTQHPERIRYVDQCALNAVLFKNWKKLDNKFNLIYSAVPDGMSKKDVVAFCADKVVIHFTLQRPWSLVCRNRLSFLYHDYLKRSPAARRVKKYNDVSTRNVLRYLVIRLLHLYFDIPFLPNRWKKAKQLTLSFFTRLRRILRSDQNVLNVEIPYSQRSIIVPTESWLSSSNERLIDIALEAVRHARKIDHSDIVSKMEEYPYWPNIWPGEHYKLLSGLIQALQPKLVIEIGTATGYSAIAMKKFISPQSKIITFDIIPWNEFPKCILKDEDFSDGRLEQIIGDLSDPKIFADYSGILAKADFVFIDAAKDGIQEQIFIDHFKTLQYHNKPIFMFDDIRLMNMIDIWNNLNKPKLDLTSFGHWAGTGLVDWTALN